jgi:uncharacterized damage-inducible protein DinB
MNSLIEGEFPLHQAAGRLRYYLLGILSDDDLAYKLPGDNPTLGGLFREIGEVEHNYIQSFKTLQYEPSYQALEPELTTRVASLQVWYRALDDEFEAVVRGFSEDDLHQQQIARGQGFAPSVFVQFQIYHEALLMFYAKASVYLKALQKPVSDEWQAAIG